MYTEELQILREESLFDPAFKGAIHVAGDLLWQTSKNTECRLLKHVIKERFVLAMMGIQFPRNHKFFEIFNRKLQEMATAGLIEHSASSYLSWLKPNCYKKYRLKFENDDPKVLSLKDLEAGFVIWLSFICLSVFVFVLEWIWRLTESFVLKKF
jgi:hypothetical protein